MSELSQHPPVDADARRRIRTSLDESLMVEAAAGTGKTTELVQRLVAVVEQGRAQRGMAGIVAVTFTRKAAGELKLRLRQELDKARLEARAAGRPEGQCRALEEALGRLEEAHIGTIHSFCAELIRERPVEAGVDPAFQGLSEESGPRVFEEAFQAWVQQALDDPPEGVRRALGRLAVTPMRNNETPLDRLRQAAVTLAEWRDFPAPWRRPRVDLRAEIDRLVLEVTQLAATARRSTNARDYLRMSLEPVEALAGWIERAEEVAPRDYDEIEARLAAGLGRLDRRKGSGPFLEGVSRQSVVDARDRLWQELADFRELAGADLAACLREDLQAMLACYKGLKERSGQLDFTDLLICARDMLRDQPQVRSFFQTRFTHIFVDEFQDTDPLQTELLLLLSGTDPSVDDWRRVTPAAGKLFLVGDPKQSIYRFRRADVVHYQEVQAVLEARGVGLVHLQQSFRATAPIQAAVNHAFATAMQRDLEHGQPEYIPMAPRREAPAGQPSVIALPVSRPYNNWGRITQRQIEASLPEDVVAFVEWLLQDSGWQVDDPARHEPRPLAAADVCILFRRYMSWGNDMTRPYTRGFEARGIPHVLVGARTFHQREEVETLRAALAAVEWPDDELAVFATLRGALFSFDDETLFTFRQRFRLHPFRPGAEDASDAEMESFGRVFEALGLLADLHRRRNRRPFVETVQTLLERTRAHAAFALRPAGAQVLANVQRICDLARSYELSGGLSFRGFVERLASEASQPTGGQAPMVEEGAEGVRLMTVHSAKGLEFPVVVLADMTASLSHDSPDRHVDTARGLCATRLLGCSPVELLESSALEAARDRAEGVRIAYVAATRARDLLVVPAVGDGPTGGWLEPLNAALYPPREEWREALPGPGCPLFGAASVSERPQDFDGRPEASVRPGLHRRPVRPAAGGDPARRRGGRRGAGLAKVERVA
jgi:ATP-dependent exoDNAse (exonuclease V) beta subunit